MSPVQDCSAQKQAIHGYMFCFSAASSSVLGIFQNKKTTGFRVLEKKTTSTRRL